MVDLVVRYLDLARGVALGSGPWLAFNAVLATVPAVLALVLFRRRRRPSAPWWAGVTLFVLFLPNAPYVLTDVVHLRSMVEGYPGTRASVVVPAGALAALVVWGLASYALCLALVDRWVRRQGWARYRVPLRAAVHVLCGIGIVLGRIPRLHSWHVFTRPADTLDGIVSVFHPLAVPLVLALAVTIALAAAALTAVAEAAVARTRELVAGARAVLAGGAAGT